MYLADGGFGHDSAGIIAVECQVLSNCSYSDSGGVVSSVEILQMLLVYAHQGFLTTITVDMMMASNCPSIQLVQEITKFWWVALLWMTLEPQ